MGARESKGGREETDPGGMRGRKWHDPHRGPHREPQSHSPSRRNCALTSARLWRAPIQRRRKARKVSPLWRSLSFLSCTLSPSLFLPQSHTPPHTIGLDCGCTKPPTSLWLVRRRQGRRAPRSHQKWTRCLGQAGYPRAGGDRRVPSCVCVGVCVSVYVTLRFGAFFLPPPSLTLLDVRERKGKTLRLPSWRVLTADLHDY